MSWKLLRLGMVGILLTLASTGAAEIEKRVFRAVRTDTAPVLDGQLDDACWARSEVADDWRRFLEHTPATEQSQARLLYDDAHVYFGIHCDEPRMDLVRQDVAANPDTFNYGLGNTVEIFFDPGGSKTRYWQFMINTNRKTETHFATRDVMHIGELEWQAGVFLGDDFFSVEVAVPIAMLHLTPKAGTKWGLNFCRARQIGKKEAVYMYSSWQPMRGSFLQPAQFGTIVFDVDLSRFFYSVSAPEIVRPGELCRIRVTNLTGALSQVKAMVSIAPLKAEPRQHSALLSLAKGQTVELDCGVFRPQDVGAEIRVTLTDPIIRQALFIGATQTIDETR